MSQKWPVNRFTWVEGLSGSNKDFIKSYNEKSYEGYFFEVDIQYPKTSHEAHNDLTFLPEIKKVNKVEKLVANLRDKKNIICK